eukprot:3926008-Pyramimonas_sp.AAC.2
MQRCLLSCYSRCSLLLGASVPTSGASSSARLADLSPVTNVYTASYVKAWHRSLHKQVSSTSSKPYLSNRIRDTPVSKAPTSVTADGSRLRVFIALNCIARVNRVGTKALHDVCHSTSTAKKVVWTLLCGFASGAALVSSAHAELLLGAHPAMPLSHVLQAEVEKQTGRDIAYVHDQIIRMIRTMTRLATSVYRVLEVGTWHKLTFRAYTQALHTVRALGFTVFRDTVCFESV